MEKKFLVYKAAAGSGKTFNLARIFVEELIRKEGDSIENNLRAIMAITFTHKAASEMKDRVLSFLQIIHENKDGDDTARLLIQTISESINISKADVVVRCGIALGLIMENFSQLSISTIDSFSHRVVRSFAKELNLHYDFDVSLDYRSWIELAVDRLFDRFGSKTIEGKELSNTLINFFITQFEQGSSWNLKWQLNDFAFKNFNDELHDTYEKHKELSTFDLHKTVKELKDPIQEYISELKKLGDAALELMDKHGLTSDDFYYKNKGIFGFFNAASKGESIYKLPNAYVLKTAEEDKWAASKISSDAANSIESIKGELNYYLNSLIELKEEGQSIKLNKLVLDQIHIMALISFIVKELNLIRQEENILLISDFNVLIDKVVKEESAPFIYERLGERYRHFLLDEFQDTSIKQWHNFVPLFCNAIAENNRNLIVGDGKQAIYRFRGGEVELFTDLPKIYKANSSLFKEYDKSLEESYQAITLGNNYRSAKAIVAFNNSFFDKIKITLGEFGEVYSDHEQDAIVDDEGYVKCEILSNEELKEEDLYLSRTLESIRECVEDGFNYGDIAILARKKDNLKSLATFLSENGIDVVSDESLVLKNQEDISLIISVMRYLIQPEDLQTKYELYRTLIYKYEKDSYKDLELMNKRYIPVGKKLNQLGFHLNQEYLRSLSLLELSNEIELKFKLGISINAYYTTFLDIIDEYARFNGNQLDGFIEYWDDSDPSISTPENDKAVKLLTIHKAKGLEYPVVIVPYLDWTKRLTQSYHWIDTPESLNIDIPKILLKLTTDLEGSVFDKNLHKEKSKSVLDDVNLIYVAFTRAKERLYIYTSDQSGLGNISGEVLTALKGMEGMGDKSVLEIGSRTKRVIESKNEEKTKKEPIDYFFLEPVKTRVRDQNLKIAFEFKKYHSKSKNNALNYGKAVHELFSKIETRGDVDNALETAMKDGIFSMDEREILKEKIDRILTIKLVDNWFSERGEKYLERELVNSEGKLLRPDRIVIDDGKVSVIDYKTGNLNEASLKKYTIQVNQYVDALRAMEYSDVRGFIVAMEEEKVIAI
jgi:ATP-dependent exoDNAse (exonuclease V) beta subunit